MTHWKTAFLVIACSATTRAFLSRPPVALTHATTTTQLKLTAEEILARSRKAAGQPDSLPMVFDDDILEDMQKALLTLEKRVQEGPGSLDTPELETLTEQLDRIVDEMHRNPHRRHVKPVRETEAAAGAPPTTQAPPPRPQATAVQPQKNEQDENNDEGPAYDGKGGMGQPRGTVNTYIIEGMDEMTSEEYRLALQQSIIDKQRARRAAGHVGNRGSLDYLHSLSPGGTDSQRRDRPDDEDNTPSSSSSWKGWQK